MPVPRRRCPRLSGYCKAGFEAGSGRRLTRNVRRAHGSCRARVSWRERAVLRCGGGFVFCGIAVRCHARRGCPTAVSAADSPLSASAAPPDTAHYRRLRCRGAASCSAHGLWSRCQCRYRPFAVDDPLSVCGLWKSALIGLRSAPRALRSLTTRLRRRRVPRARRAGPPLGTQNGEKDGITLTRHLGHSGIAGRIRR